MKQFLIFILGVIVGVVLTFVLAFYMSSTDVNDDNIIRFDNPTEIVNEQSFEVFQVVGDNMALVHGQSSPGYYYGTLYLLVNKEGKYYYDDEIVKVPKGKVVKQVGIYRYITKSDIQKTVPIVQIMNK